MKITTAHSLPIEAALKKLQACIAEDKKTYQQEITNMQEIWEGYLVNYAFKIKNTIPISGYIEVKDSKIIAFIKLPIIMWPLKAKIEYVITQRLKQIAR